MGISEHVRVLSHGPPRAWSGDATRCGVDNRYTAVVHVFVFADAHHTSSDPKPAVDGEERTVDHVRLV